MRVLLPPSESKRPGGGSAAFRGDALAAPALGPARERLHDALIALCSDPDAGLAALKLGERQRPEIEANAALRSSPTMAAMDRYTGVLYDALDAGGLDDPARAWLGEHALIQSAAFGLIAAGDLIPAYRLSASSSLPGLTLAGRRASVKAFWRAAHAEAPFDPTLCAIDLRSADYAALNPLPAGQPGGAVRVLGRDAAGVPRALNHFNKAGKGRVVRELATQRPEIASAADFVAWARSAGHEAAETPAGIDLVIAAAAG